MIQNKTDTFLKSFWLSKEQTVSNLSEGGFGALIARAGVGKTSLMVQYAIFNQLNNKNVLYVSLNDSVEKICLWYDEVFKNIVSKYHFEKEKEQLWEAILLHRFVITFHVDGFSVSKLEERITELSEQAIFYPQIIMIDGMDFDGDKKELLRRLKKIAESHLLNVWFSMQIHRNANPVCYKLPEYFDNIEEMFEVLMLLDPVENIIQAKALKGAACIAKNKTIHLDPATMLIKG